MDELMRRGYESFVRIDEGGQAKVYKSIKQNKFYAIKVVHVEDPNNIKLDDDLKRELQIIRNVKHPNCIRVEELLRSKGKIYIIMDFMSNGTVGSWIKQHGPICEWKARAWFCPVSRAIKYLHEHKIAHRDLKLDNILLDSHWNPMVSDFGFSRFVKLTDSGQVIKSDTYCGTTSYNPPEVLKQLPYDPFAADIWCLGVMLFIMINKIYPFDRHDKQKMYECQMTKHYKLQDCIEEKSSSDLKDLIKILLEPDPEKRPTIREINEHPWFPIVYRENEILSSLRSSSLSLTRNIQRRTSE